MTAGARGRVGRYVGNSLTYLQNARGFLQQGEVGKAGELFWGSLTQAVQAVAASRGIHLANHRSLRYFISTLAKEVNDPALNDSFIRAELLHSNFHEAELDAAEVVLIAEPVVQAVQKLLSLVPPAPSREISPR